MDNGGSEDEANGYRRVETGRQTILQAGTQPTRRRRRPVPARHGPVYNVQQPRPTPSGSCLLLALVNDATTRRLL